MRMRLEVSHLLNYFSGFSLKQLYCFLRSHFSLRTTAVRWKEKTISSPMKSMSIKSRDYRTETKKVLEDLERDLRDPWEINQTPTDKIIWHYTDQRGLAAILADGKVRASNALYLNDAMEVNHARTLIYNEVSNKMGIYTDPVQAELLGHIEAGAQIANYIFQPYVACFSGESAGDLLSQWQVYGNGGVGYALGFLPQKLGTDPSSSQLRKVVYDVSTQQKLIREAIDKYCTELRAVVTSVSSKPGMLGEAILDFSHSIDKIFYEYLYCFKHPSWEAEREWRLVRRIVPFRATPGVPDAGELKFRESTIGIPTPFVELDLTEKDPNDFIRRMPLERIIVGPKIPYRLAENSLRQLLRKSHYDGVKIERSESTLI